MTSSIYQRFFLLLLASTLFACGSADTTKEEEVKEPTVEIEEPPKTGSGNLLKGIVEHYNDSYIELGPISYIEKWDKWLVGTEEVQAQYKSFEEYFKDNPFQVTVDGENEYLKIIDPGTGGGTFTVTAKLYEMKDGNQLLGRIETAASPEETENELHFAAYKNRQWGKHPATIEAIAPRDFFEGEFETVEQHEMLSLLFELEPKEGSIKINSSPNYMYFCKDGQFPAAESMEENAVDAICKAWKAYKKDHFLAASWDKRYDKFVVK